MSLNMVYLQNKSAKYVIIRLKNEEGCRILYIPCYDPGSFGPGGKNMKTMVTELQRMDNELYSMYQSSLEIAEMKSGSRKINAWHFSLLLPVPAAVCVSIICAITRPSKMKNYFPMIPIPIRAWKRLTGKQ